MRLRLGASLVSALLVLLVLAAPAAASYDSISGGFTKIRLNRGFLATLKKYGVNLSARAPATRSGATLLFPIAGGKLDPTSAKGTVAHQGALIIQRGHHRLPLKGLTLKSNQAHAPLSGKFGGSQLRFGTSAKLVTSRTGFGLQARVPLLLGAKIAQRLAGKLRLHGVFTAGQRFGSALTRVELATVAIKPVGTAELELAPSFSTKLASLFVAVNPIFPAEHLGTPFILPLSGGKLAPDGSQGTVQSSGSLELIQQDGGQVFLRDPWADLGAHEVSVELELDPAPPNAGKVGRVSILDLGVGSVVSNPSTRTIDLSGASLTLQATTAQALNSAFAMPQGKAEVFVTGEPMFTLSFGAQAK